MLCRCTAARPLHPGCLSQPLLPVWMNVSFNSLVVGLPYSLIFWHCWFLFLNLFFWLFKEAKCIYLYLHLVQKSPIYLSLERRREGERERNSNVWLRLACPLLGTGPAVEACAVIGNRTGEPFAGWHSVHWATQARAKNFITNRITIKIQIRWVVRNELFYWQPGNWPEMYKCIANFVTFHQFFEDCHIHFARVVVLNLIIETANVLLGAM